MLCAGEDLAESGGQESSSVVVETVQKVSKHQNKGPVVPLFKSDASKVTCKGMGLKKAYLQKQNQFTINASEAGEYKIFLSMTVNHGICYLKYENITVAIFAGNNIVFVGVYGPKGPCEEVFIKHLGHNNYQVNYVVRDRGEYIIMCKWGDDHIPGTIHIMI